MLNVSSYGLLLHLLVLCFFFYSFILTFTLAGLVHVPTLFIFLFTNLYYR